MMIIKKIIFHTLFHFLACIYHSSTLKIQVKYKKTYINFYNEIENYKFIKIIILLFLLVEGASAS